MIRWFFILISILVVEKLPAQISVSEIISKSKKYYQQKVSGFINIESKSKSSIAEAVTIDSFQLSYDREKREMILFAGTGEILFYKKMHLYQINKRNNTFSDLSVYKSAGQDFLTGQKDYPFFFLTIFSRFKNEVFKSRPYNGFFQIYNTTDQYNFDTVSFAIKHFKRVSFSQYGVQLKEWKVLEETYPGRDHTKFTDTANAYLTKFTKSTVIPEITEINLINKPLASFFKQTLLSSINAGEIDILHRKDSFLLIDLFYQSCMPCVASFPFIKKLIKKYDQTGKLMVIGMDPVENDSTSMLKFIQRYGLAYPVVVGSSVKNDISKLNSNGMYPKYILADSKGIIIAVYEGFSEDHFREIELRIDKGD